MKPSSLIKPANKAFAEILEISENCLFPNLLMVETL